jgi:hypothetical protein
VGRTFEKRGKSVGPWVDWWVASRLLWFGRVTACCALGFDCPPPSNIGRLYAARELATDDAHERAFARYERAFKPFIEAKQRSAKRFGWWFAPRSALTMRLRGARRRSANIVPREMCPTKKLGARSCPGLTTATSSLGSWPCALRLSSLAKSVSANCGAFPVGGRRSTAPISEFGIRVALGATLSNVIGLVVRRALAMGSVGIALGIIGAAVLTRGIQSLLFHVSSIDPLSSVAAALTLLAAVFIGSWIKARRIGAIDPLGAIRAE